MITTANVDAIDTTIRNAVAKLPEVIADMRDTAVDRERLIEENKGLRHEIDTMNVTMGDLRADKQAMDGRIGALLAENAKLEHLLKTIGRAVKESEQVQDSLAQLAAQQNGKKAPVIEHEQTAEKAAWRPSKRSGN